MTQSPVDLVFAVLLAFAALRAYSKGLLGTAVGYVAPVLGFLMAADWSDPVRERLASAMPAPDFVLDLAAPFVVFVVVVASLRLASSLLSGVFGLGTSMPSRVLAGLAGATVTAMVLGSLVLVTRELKPEGEAPADEASGILLSPFESFVSNLDGRFAESRLAAPLADLASMVVTVAARHKDEFHLPAPERIEEVTREAAAAAAAVTIRQLPVEEMQKQAAGAARKAAEDASKAVRQAAQDAAGAKGDAVRPPAAGTR
jgi:hypothetical protein